MPARRVAVGSNHCAAELLPQGPRRFVPSQSELSLELRRRECEFAWECAESRMAHRRVTIGEFRNHLSSYVLRAERGETIAICRRNRVVALLQPLKHPGRKSSGLLGSLKGTARIVADYRTRENQRPLVPAERSGRELWGDGSTRTVRKLRDEWSR
jgi:prevent-host-death family protein